MTVTSSPVITRTSWALFMGKAMSFTSIITRLSLLSSSISCEGFCRKLLLSSLRFRSLQGNHHSLITVSSLQVRPMHKVGSTSAIRHTGEDNAFFLGRLHSNGAQQTRRILLLRHDCVVCHKPLCFHSLRCRGPAAYAISFSLRSLFWPQA